MTISEEFYKKVDEQRELAAQTGKVFDLSYADMHDFFERILDTMFSEDNTEPFRMLWQQDKDYLQKKLAKRTYQKKIYWLIEGIQTSSYIVGPRCLDEKTWNDIGWMMHHLDLRIIPENELKVWAGVASRDKKHSAHQQSVKLYCFPQKPNDFISAILAPQLECRDTKTQKNIITLSFEKIKKQKWNSFLPLIAQHGGEKIRRVTVTILENWTNELLKSVDDSLATNSSVKSMIPVAIVVITAAAIAAHTNHEETFQSAINVLMNVATLPFEQLNHGEDDVYGFILEALSLINTQKPRKIDYTQIKQEILRYSEVLSEAFNPNDFNEEAISRYETLGEKKLALSHILSYAWVFKEETLLKLITPLVNILAQEDENFVFPPPFQKFFIEKILDNNNLLNFYPITNTLVSYPSLEIEPETSKKIIERMINSGNDFIWECLRGDKKTLKAVTWLLECDVSALKDMSFDFVDADTDVDTDSEAFTDNDSDSVVLTTKINIQKLQEIFEMRLSRFLKQLKEEKNRRDDDDSKDMETQKSISQFFVAIATRYPQMIEPMMEILLEKIQSERYNLFYLIAFQSLIPLSHVPEKIRQEAIEKIKFKQIDVYVQMGCLITEAMRRDFITQEAWEVKKLAQKDKMLLEDDLSFAAGSSSPELFYPPLDKKEVQELTERLTALRKFIQERKYCSETARSELRDLTRNYFPSTQKGNDKNATNVIVPINALSHDILNKIFDYLPEKDKKAFIATNKVIKNDPELLYSNFSSNALDKQRMLAVRAGKVFDLSCSDELFNRLLEDNSPQNIDFLRALWEQNESYFRKKLTKKDYREKMLNFIKNIKESLDEESLDEKTCNKIGWIMHHLDLCIIPEKELKCWATEYCESDYGDIDHLSMRSYCSPQKPHDFVSAILAPQLEHSDAKTQQDIVASIFQDIREKESRGMNYFLSLIAQYSGEKIRCLMLTTLKNWANELLKLTDYSWEDTARIATVASTVTLIAAYTANEETFQSAINILMDLATLPSDKLGNNVNVNDLYGFILEALSFLDAKKPGKIDYTKIQQEVSRYLENSFRRGNPIRRTPLRWLVTMENKYGESVNTENTSLIINALIASFDIEGLTIIALSHPDKRDKLLTSVENFLSSELALSLSLYHDEFSLLNIIQFLHTFAPDSKALIDTYTKKFYDLDHSKLLARDEKMADKRELMLSKILSCAEYLKEEELFKFMPPMLNLIAKEKGDFVFSAPYPDSFIEKILDNNDRSLNLYFKVKVLIVHPSYKIKPETLNKIIEEVINLNNHSDEEYDVVKIAQMWMWLLGLNCLEIKGKQESFISGFIELAKENNYNDEINVESLKSMSQIFVAVAKRCPEKLQTMISAFLEKIRNQKSDLIDVAALQSLIQLPNVSEQMRQDAIKTIFNDEHTVAQLTSMEDFLAQMIENNSAITPELVPEKLKQTYVRVHLVCLIKEVMRRGFITQGAWELKTLAQERIVSIGEILNLASKQTTFFSLEQPELKARLTKLRQFIEEKKYCSETAQSELSAIINNLPSTKDYLAKNYRKTLCC